MKTLLRYAGAYVLAVTVGTVLGCIAATQFVLLELTRLGIEIPFSTRLATTAHDVGGMSRVLSIILAVAFFIAFLVAGLCARFLPGSRPGWFSIAGASSILVALYLLYESIGGTLIAGARSNSGLLAQALACGAAGWIFARVTRKPEGAGS